jgi:uncharacterized Rmd1/YagE family protein
MNTQPQSYSCQAFITAKEFDFTELYISLSKHYLCERYRESMYLKWKSGDVFLFEFGCFVAWGVDAQDMSLLDEHLKHYSNDIIEPAVSDELTYVEAQNTYTLIKSDSIFLHTNDYMEKYAISHAIAQSLKLAEMELFAEKTINETSHIPENMAKEGKTRLSRKNVSKMRGHLFLVESNISLHYALLDTPEFFWEYPEYEEAYRKTAEYLDVAARVDVLNKKLKIIHDMFDMLADEQKHQHSSLLEWIIIWLIAVEIAIFFFHDLLKWF